MQAREMFEGEIGQESTETPQEDRWNWRPTQWQLGFQRSGDSLGGKITVDFGPFVFTVSGNALTGFFGRPDNSSKFDN